MLLYHVSVSCIISITADDYHDSNYLSLIINTVMCHNIVFARLVDKESRKERRKPKKKKDKYTVFRNAMLKLHQ